MPTRLRIALLLLALPGLRCAEATYVEDDVPSEVDGAKKDDAATTEDLGEDAKLPPEDLGEPTDAAVELDAPPAEEAGADVLVEQDVAVMDAGGPDVVVNDAGVMDTGVVDTGVVDTGVVDTGPRDTGVVDTGPRDTGPIDTGVVDTGPIDTGVVDTGATYPPILCPLLGTPIPITCRSRDGLRPCCGPGGICFCEQSSPFGPLCLPCS